MFGALSSKYDCNLALHMYTMSFLIAEKTWNKQGGKVHCVLLSSHFTSSTLCRMCCQSVCKHSQTVGDKSEGNAIMHLMRL